MIKFLIKGILHDRSRSLLPVIVVSIGVMITVLLHCWINGIFSEAVVMSANFNNGHMKVMTRAYAKESNQMPNDLAILGADSLEAGLKQDFPDIDWVKRIRFGALIDFPDSAGETRAQGPITGWAIDLFTPGSKESDRFNLQKSVITGHLPVHLGEALISFELADKFGIIPGDIFTLFGTTMDGSMAFRNFTVAGTVRFGVTAIDRGAVIADISDIQAALSMEDAASEILGFFPDNQYHEDKANMTAGSFNKKYDNSGDEFAPLMVTFREQEGMGDLLDMIHVASTLLIMVFVLAMSVVLWNAGLLGGLRRFSEFGVRLALGEDKGHIYRTLILEGLLVGFIGTVIGMSIGLAISYMIQAHGVDFGGLMKNSTMMIPSVVRTVVTPAAFYIGFIPGMLSVLAGNALAGLRIYRRKTASLFKELEV
jgi:putative ABC transport system permease protein